MIRLMTHPDMLALRRALEASWQPDTAYHHAEQAGNPALGQCYVTARVIQHYFPLTEIVEGEVITSTGTEKHFWNVFDIQGSLVHLDLTWQQFPQGSQVKSWRIRSRNTFNDSEPTIQRVERLLQRVQRELQQ